MMMAEPGQPARDVAIIVEAIGSKSSTTDNNSSNAGKEKNPQMKTSQDLLEAIILKNAKSNLRNEKKVIDREHLLNAKATRWRTIFSKWPRDPKGKYITPDNSQPGKMAPNRQQIWGATLFDFFTVHRIPELHTLCSLSSGSKLSAWMKKNGEDFAKDNLQYAELEPDPELVLPYNISRLIQDGDARVRGKSWVRDDQDQDVVGKGKGKEREDWQLPQPVRLLIVLYAYINVNRPVAPCIPL